MSEEKKIRIEKGDCLEFAKKHIATRAIDMVVTSPPYDNLRKYNGFEFDEDATIKALYDVVKIGGVVAWVVQDATVKGSKTGSSFRQALKFKEAGFNIHDVMIWDKTFSTAPPSKVRYNCAFEYIFIFSKGAPKNFTPIKDKVNRRAGTKSHGGGRKADGATYKTKLYQIKEFGQRLNIWQIFPHMARNENKHPAPFPVQLAADLIISWTRPGDLVFDPFTGSGSTAVAALQTGRQFIGCDISAEYVEMAKNRILSERKNK